MIRRTAALAAFFATLLVTGCNETKAPTFQGWIEADLIFVSPDEVGRIEMLSVREGDQVALRAPLFTLDADLQQADMQQNQATLANARQAFERAQQLLRTGSGTQKAFDDAQSALREIEARLNSVQTRLARRKVFSPATGTIQQVYYRPGEMVPAGRPVVSILPPGNIKLRFFVGEPMLPAVKVGDPVEVTCDGCREPISAKVSFIARSAEYTPPVIYSLEERNKLVFMIEARTEAPDGLRVGQPVSVALAGAKK